MPLADRVQQLDEQIAAALKSKLAGLRTELNERLRQSTEALRERIDGLDAVLPASFVGDHDLEPIAAEAAAAARSRTLSEHAAAVAALDQAGSQAEILAALLVHSRAHASRAALFLTPTEAARGWRGEGFADAGAALPGLEISYAEGTAWGALAQGRSTVALSTADCAELASRLESPVAREAVLVPLVLADRVAAALYADQSGDGVLEVAALQALVHSAAQAIELLPLRSRGASPTFQGPGAVTGSAAGLPLWAVPAPSEAPVQDEAPAPTEAPVPDEPPAPAAQEAEAPVEEPGAPETEPVAEVPAWWMSETAAVIEEAAEPGVTEPVEMDETAALSAPEAVSWPAPEGVPGGIPGAAPEPLAIASWEDTAAELFPPLSLEDEPPVAAFSSAASTATLPAFSAGEPAPPFAVEPEIEPRLELEEEEIDLPDIDQIAFPEAEPLAEEPVFDELPPVGLEPATAVLEERSLDLADDETLLLSRSSATVAFSTPSAPASAPQRPVPDDEPEEEATHPGRAPFLTTRLPTQPTGAPPASVAGPGGGGTSAAAGSAEVRPPSGFEGPGLAFSAGPRPVAGGGGDGAAQEEARRLARLLVSEIRLYNEEQVEEGRRNRDIYFRLRDEIDRSRKMYDERIAPEVRAGSDYFTEELIRRLADGDPDALGM